jgi:(p)ppGpp synthase/HD superfamily hydrolase
MTTIEKTIELIKIFHNGQFDRTGVPYWQHPVDVMNNLHPSASDEDRLIALLHDVPEDCCDGDWEKAKAILEEHGYSGYVRRGVLLLTRINGHFLHHRTMEITSGTYHEYVKNIMASGHTGAILVKFSDNQMNSNPERIARIADATERQKVQDMAANRYARSMALLQPVIAGLKLERKCRIVEAPEESSTEYFWAKCAYDCGIETDSYGYVDDAESAFKAATFNCRKCA